MAVKDSRVTAPGVLAASSLRSQLRGAQRVGVVVCGANIDLATFFRQADGQ